MHAEASGAGSAIRAGALTLLLAGCAADDLAGPRAVGRDGTPDAPPAASAAVVAPLAVDPTETVAVAVRDAIERVVPALAEEVPITKLHSALQRMATALEGGDREALFRAAGWADQAVAELREGYEDELETQVHLDVVGLVIDRALSLGTTVDESRTPTGNRNR